MSARKPMARLDPPLRSVPTTPVFPSPRLTSNHQGFELFGKDISRPVSLVSCFRLLMDNPTYLRKFVKIGVDLRISVGFFHATHAPIFSLYQPFTRSQRPIMVLSSNTS